MLTWYMARVSLDPSIYDSTYRRSVPRLEDVSAVGLPCRANFSFSPSR